MSPRSEPELPWEARHEEEEREALPPFLYDPLGVLQRRWTRMLAVLLVGLVITAFLAWRWQPSYTAQATVLVSSQQIPEAFVRSTVNEDSIANISAMLGEVLSQENLSRLLDDFALYPGAADELSRAELVSRMRNHFELAPITKETAGGTSLIYGISFTNESAENAAGVANAAAALLVEASVSGRSRQAKRATRFLRRELERDERDLNEAARAVAEFRRQNRGKLPSELETNLRRLELLSDRRAALVEQIASKETRIAAIAATGAPGASDAERLLDELQKQLASEMAVNTEEHPNVISLRRRVTSQRSVVEAERRRPGAHLTPEAQALVAAERRERDTIREQLAATEAATIVLDRLIDESPAVAEQLSALEHKETVLREDYLDSLRKVEEAELAESLESEAQGAQVAILDPAQLPASPARTRGRVLVLGLAASLAVALGLALLLELLDPVVLNARQIESLAERPVLGSFPRMA